MTVPFRAPLWSAPVLVVLAACTGDAGNQDTSDTQIDPSDLTVTRRTCPRRLRSIGRGSGYRRITASPGSCRLARGLRSSASTALPGLAGELRAGVQKLKDASPAGVLLGSGTLATELDRLGLIDEYKFLVHPRIAGHGPTLYNGGLR